LAFYNLGNAFFKKDKFKEAAEAYKRSLGLNPADKQAKWNLEIALQKQKEDEKKKQDDQKNQDDKKKDDKKDDQKKDDKKKDDKKDDQKKDDKKKDDKSGQPDQKKDQNQKDQADQPPPRPSDKPNEQQIDAVLDNLERSSKDLEKERARARAVRRAPPARDW
jgi:Ca-activated chloride channel family protein